MTDAEFGFIVGSSLSPVSLARLAMLVSLGLPACSEDPPGFATGGSGGTREQGGAGSGTTGGVSNGGSGGISGGNQGVEDLGIRVLDRPLRQTYDCSVSRPISLLSERWSGAELLPSDAGPKLLWASTPESFGLPTATLGFSSLSLEGALGSPKPITDDQPGWVIGVESATDGGQTWATWLYMDASDRRSYQVVSFDGEGALVLPPATLTSISDTERFGTLQLPHIAPSANGSLLLYGNRSQGSETVQVVSLTAQGEIAGTPQILFADTQAFALRLLPIANGFLAFYGANSALDRGMYLRRLDGQGIPRGDSVRIAEGASIPKFFVRGEQVWAAWSEEEGDPLAQQSAGTLRIARFDANGARVAPDVRLQAPVLNQFALQLHFIDMGDDVGLLWSKQSVVYICAGCHSDAHLEFVVLDGTDLTPKSQMVSLPNLKTLGGLTDARAQRIGDELLIVSTVQYHTWAEGASASLRCVKK